MGFPGDLPDVARLRPPGGNSRLDGIEQSYVVLKQKQMLAAARHRRQISRVNRIRVLDVVGLSLTHACRA
jgi:hypothetical protein